MSCDFLLSLRKLINWLFAFLMALLPQHLIAQLGDADLFPIAAYGSEAPKPDAAAVAHAASGTSDEESRDQAKPGATHTQARPMR